MLETDHLTSLTDRELAKWHAEAKEAHPRFEILAENEWRMRQLRIHRDFNEAIVKKQMTLTRYGIGFALAGVIIGALLTFFLPRLLPSNKSVLPSEISIQSSQSTSESILPKTLDRHTGSEQQQENVSSKVPPSEKNEQNR